MTLILNKFFYLFQFDEGWRRRPLLMVSWKFVFISFETDFKNWHHLYHTEAKVRDKKFFSFEKGEFYIWIHSLIDPIGTPILPFSSNLWLAVIISYFLSVLFYKIMRILQRFVDKSLEGVAEETISEIFLNMIGIYVLQSVKMRWKTFRPSKLLFVWNFNDNHIP